MRRSSSVPGQCLSSVPDLVARPAAQGAAMFFLLVVTWCASHVTHENKTKQKIFNGEKLRKKNIKGLVEDFTYITDETNK